jgi:cytochrome P450
MFRRILRARPIAERPLFLWESREIGNPFPLYDEFRRAAPIVKVRSTSGYKAWIATRFDAAASILKDPRLMVDHRKQASAFRNTVERVVMRSLGLHGLSLVTSDGLEHERLRSGLHEAFTGQIFRSVSLYAEQMSDELIDRLVAKGSVDFISDFARPFPLLVLSELIGIPLHLREELQKLVLPIFSFLTSDRNIILKLSHGLRIKRFVDEIIQYRRRRPDERVLTRLIAASSDGVLTGDELVVMVILLLFAGHETTANLIGNGVNALIENPEQFDLLRSQPQHVDAAVGELLRFASPIEHGMARYIPEDIEIGGILIPRGEIAVALLSAASRDERVFKNPDSLDITRRNTQRLGFGLGSHVCPGAAFARMEAGFVLRGLVSRVKNVKLAVPRDTLQWWGAVGLRGIKALPVSLS